MINRLNFGFPPLKPVPKVALFCMLILFDVHGTIDLMNDDQQKAAVTADDGGDTILRPFGDRPISYRRSSRS